MIKIALVGQPNCGKSTLFNNVAGYKSVVANFPGTTLEYLTSKISLNNEEFTLIDLPGIYSLASPESEEILCRRCLAENLDVIVNVVDASMLSRSIELTLELIDLQKPLVVCLNMMDEAGTKGIEIDVAHLSEELGVPVIPAVATKGKGVPELFSAALAAAQSGACGRSIPYSDDVEKVAAELGNLIYEKTLSSLGVSSRLLSLKLLENDAEFESMALRHQPDLAEPLRNLREKIAAAHGKTSEQVISSERHALAMNLFEHVARVKSRAGKSWQERLDQVFMHPQGGYALLACIMAGFFLLVFMIGKEIEIPLLALFEKFSQYLNVHVPHGSLVHNLLNGLIQGFSGGIGIALPYLVPFLIGLSLLEDTGYLPRAAFLLDFIMHRFGLHGKSIIPFVLSYGCNVPAIMSARILERPRDRYITAALSTLIPCAARTTIIFGIVGFFIGPLPALLLYLLNIVVIAATGKVLSRLLPDHSQGMVLEIPPYRMPSVQSLIKKTWFRLREFIVIAWPLLIAGSLILSLPLGSRD